MENGENGRPGDHVVKPVEVELKSGPGGATIRKQIMEELNVLARHLRNELVEQNRAQLVKAWN